MSGAPSAKGSARIVPTTIRIVVGATKIQIAMSQASIPTVTVALSRQRRAVEEPCLGLVSFKTAA
jgi:hypothetical protein